MGTASGSDRGWADGAAGMAKFDEPGGLSAANGKLYIADTNNHLVRVFDPASGVAFDARVQQPGHRRTTERGPGGAPGAVPVKVSPTASNLRLTISSPPSYHLNASAPSRVELTSGNPAIVNLGERSISFNSDEASVTLPVPVELHAGSTTLTLNTSLYYCRTGEEALCFIGQFELVVPVSVTAGSTAGEFMVNFELPES